jgi:hypothetical protein
MVLKQRIRAIVIVAAATLVGLTWLAGRAGAQVAEPWVLYAHDTQLSRTLTIDTTTGLARPIGDSGFSATSAGLEMSGGPVPSQGGITYPKDTAFGLFRDATFNKDYVIVLDNNTGRAVKTVELDLTVGGRGVAFGPDGTTMYVYVAPGILYTVNTVTGAISSIGEVADSAGNRYSGVSLQYDPISREFLALAGPNTGTLIRIRPADAQAQTIAQLDNFSSCTITRVPGPVAGPGGKVYPGGTFFTINNRNNTLHALTVDTVGLKLLADEEIGALGPNAGQVCASAFSLAYTPWASPTHPGPAAPTATRTATAAIEPTATSVRATATATRGAVGTPASPSCVCPEVLKLVPNVVVLDALANPARYYGWRYPLDMGKPPSPANPPRECLTLPNTTVPYHPLWNRPLWKVGCR